MSHWENKSVSSEWYTPKYVFDALDCVFDLDVAHPRPPTVTNVPCLDFYSHNGLSRPWRGFVWMNPPYEGRNTLGAWLARLERHGAGVGLTPDRTSAPWFQTSAPRAHMLLFMPKVQFVRPDGSKGKQPSNGSCLWAYGPRAVHALQRASMAGIGFTLLPQV